MVEEAVTYTVEDEEVPTIWAGKDYDETNTLEVAIEENTGDILNTSRKATFTFPEGIEVVDIDVDGVKTATKNTNLSMKSMKTLLIFGTTVKKKSLMKQI